MGNCLRILLVYDNQESRRQIEKILQCSDIEEFRLECVTAQSVIQGATPNRHQDVCLIETIGQRASHLILSLKATLGCPILALTWNSGSEVLNALHCGASDCLIRNQLTAAGLEEAMLAAVEHARTQAMLGQYERWYLSFLDNTSDVIFTLDLDGNFISVNRVIERLTGYTQDEVLAMNLRQIVSTEYTDLVAKSSRRMLEDRKPATRELAIVAKDWRRIPVRMSFHLVYEFGRPIGFQGVIRARGQTVLLRAAG